LRDVNSGLPAIFLKYEMSYRTRLFGGNAQSTIFWHNVRMPNEHILELQRADQARTDLAAIECDLQFVMGRLARMPTGAISRRPRSGSSSAPLSSRPYSVGSFGISRPMTGASLIIALAVMLACPVPLSAKEYRSREVTREFSNGSIPVLRPDEPAALVLAIAKITLNRSLAEDQTRFPTCNGRPSPTPKRKTGGNAGLALDGPRCAVPLGPIATGYQTAQKSSESGVIAP
jgi:hypothetical protein